MIINLNQSNQTGLFSTTPGAAGMISSAGNFAPNSRVGISYSHSGAYSGNFVGMEDGFFRGNFSQDIKFPGSFLRVILFEPGNYTDLSIEVVAS